jgi:hypothetical protein
MSKVRTALHLGCGQRFYEGRVQREIFSQKHEGEKKSEGPVKRAREKRSLRGPTSSRAEFCARRRARTRAKRELTSVLGNARIYWKKDKTDKLGAREAREKAREKAPTYHVGVMPCNICLLARPIFRRNGCFRFSVPKV